MVDRDRNAVTIINSLFSTFGSGITDGEDRHPAASPRLGLQSRCPAIPNCIGPSKRPLHTIIPALAVRDGRVDMAFGVMGGAYQAMGHAHVVSNLVDYGMDLQTAIDWPRVFFEGDRVEVENGVSDEVMQEMRAVGHDVVRRALPLAAVRRSGSTGSVAC